MGVLEQRRRSGLTSMEEGASASGAVSMEETALSQRQGGAELRLQERISAPGTPLVRVPEGQFRGPGSHNTMELGMIASPFQ